MSAGFPELPPEHDPEPVRRVLESLGYEGDSEGVAAGVTEPTYVLVHKQEGGERVRLFRMDPDEFTNGGGVELVQNKYGAGKYIVEVRKNRGGIIAAKTIVLGAPLAPVAQPGGDGDRLDRLERAIATLVERASSPAAAPLPGFFDAVGTVAKMLSDQQGKLLELVLAKGSPAAAGVSPDKLLELVLRGVELGREQGARGGGFGDTVAELLPGALRALATMPGAAAAPAPELGGPASSPRALPPARAPEHELAAAPAWVRVLAPHVPQLLNLAAVRADPEHWAEQVSTMVDGERLTFIEDQLARGPAFREEFFASFPDTMASRSWFERFFDELRAVIADMRADDDDGHQDEQPGG